MSAKTIFVTGATGFIAKHLVLQLLNAGHRVIGSVRSMGRADEVRDVAAAYVRALDHPESIGKRILMADRFIWTYEMAEVLKAAYRDRKIVTRRAPTFVVRILAVFDKSIASILPILGKRTDVSNARAKELLGMKFTSAEDAVRASADWLIRNTDI